MSLPLFDILFVFVVLAHDHRRIVHFNVTSSPSALVWTAQQIINAFPWDTAPRYLLRDRDSIYGAELRSRVKSMGTNEVLIAPRSPWQSPYVERLIGTLRRELLDHVIVLKRAASPTAPTAIRRRVLPSVSHASFAG